MTPVHFPECNTIFGPPPGLAASQVQPISAYVGTVATGSLEGAAIVVTAWQPDARELELLQQGRPLFLSFIGGLPPHMPTVDFAQAKNPA